MAKTHRCDICEKQYDNVAVTHNAECYKYHVDCARMRIDDVLMFLKGDHNLDSYTVECLIQEALLGMRALRARFRIRQHERGYWIIEETVGKGLYFQLPGIHSYASDAIKYLPEQLNTVIVHNEISDLILRISDSRWAVIEYGVGVGVRGFYDNDYNLGEYDSFEEASKEVVRHWSL